MKRGNIMDGAYKKEENNLAKGNSNNSLKSFIQDLVNAKNAGKIDNISFENTMNLMRELENSLNAGKADDIFIDDMIDIQKKILNRKSPGLFVEKPLTSDDFNDIMKLMKDMGGNSAYVIKKW